MERERQKEREREREREREGEKQEKEFAMIHINKSFTWWQVVATVALLVFIAHVRRCKNRKTKNLPFSNFPYLFFSPTAYKQTQQIDVSFNAFFSDKA